VLLLRFVIVSPVNFRGDDITSNQVAKLTMPLHDASFIGTGNKEMCKIMNGMNGAIARWFAPNYH
ncbi:hypothetical protein, partial [Photobacterium alginatilyticum]